MVGAPTVAADAAGAPEPPRAPEDVVEEVGMIQQPSMYNIVKQFITCIQSNCLGRSVRWWEGP